MSKFLQHTQSIFLLIVLFIGNGTSAQWHDTIYFAAPHYGGSIETFGWHEFNDSLLLVPSSTEIGWGYISRGMLNYYHEEGRKIQSAPLPNDFQVNSNSSTYYAGAFDSDVYLSHAIEDSTVITYMSRLYADTILWKANGWLNPILPGSNNFNGDQHWFEDSTSYLRMGLEIGDTFQVISKDSLLPDSIGGVSFENFWNSGYSFHESDTFERVYSYYFYDTSDQKSKRTIATLKFNLAQLRLLAVNSSTVELSSSGGGEGTVDGEFVIVRDSLVPNYSNTTTERWLHIEKLTGERVRSIKVIGRFLRSGNNIYFLKAKTIVKNKYILIHEECYFKDTLSPSGLNEPCSRVLLFGKNNKLYYDKTFKGWGGLVENKVTKMTINNEGEAYFRLTTTSTPNNASLLVKLDTTGEHQLFKLADDSNIHSPIKVSIHPNPFQENIQIESSGVGNYQLKLYSLTGQLVEKWQAKNKQFFTFNTETILPGLYLYQLENMRTGAVLKTGKLIKRE